MVRARSYVDGFCTAFINATVFDLQGDEEKAKALPQHLMGCLQYLPRMAAVANTQVGLTCH